MPSTPLRRRVVVTSSSPPRSCHASVRVRNTAAVLSVALLAGATLSACGSSSNGLAGDSPSRIVSATAAAMTNASSVRLIGSYQGKSLDLEIFSNGAASGTMSAGGPSFELILLPHGKAYVKASAAFWIAQKVPAALSSKLGGHWVTIPGGGSLGFGDLSIRALARSLQQNRGRLTKVGTRTVDGVAAVGVRSSKGGTLFVPTSGPALPIELASPSSGTFHFEDWNQLTPPTAPKHPETVPTG